MSNQTKKCPMCAEEVPLEATSCEFCGEQFAATAAGVEAEVPGRQPESQKPEETPAPAPSPQPVPAAPAAEPEPPRPLRRDSLTWLWVAFGIITALVICALAAGSILLLQ